MNANPNFRHSLRFFRDLAAAGRNDLAGDNAAIDGRLRLAMTFYRRHWPTLTARGAWTVAHRINRAAAR